MDPSTSQEPLIDVAAALRRLGGSRSLLAEMFRFFVEDAPGLLDALEHSLSRGEQEAAFRAAHSLKGLASNFDAAIVTQPAKQIEECLRKGHADEAKKLLPPLRESVSKCLTDGQRIIDAATG